LGLLQLCIRLARILFFCMWPCMTHVRGRFWQIDRLRPSDMHNALPAWSW
jgi:hypothetical protein